MNRFTTRIRTSLALKVITSTVLLSLGVVWLTGSALYSQLSDGVQQVNLESSLAEAKSSFFSAQYQFLLINGAENPVILKAVQDVIISSTEVSLSQDRKSIFLNRFGRPFKNAQKVPTPDYSTSTDGLDVSSFPDEIRKKVRSSDLVEYEYAKVRYQDREDAKVLIVGRKIVIPKSGNYEMYLVYSLNNQNRTLSIITNALLFTGFALIFLIGLITWLVVRQVVKPVREAASIAQKFTQGDFSQRMKVESSDEIATLGRAFNDMALSLESQISRLENLSRVQQRFVSDVSHELRTPLTTIKLAGELIYDNREGFAAPIKKSAEAMNSQIYRFETLLEDLLEISRYDAGAVAGDFEKVDLLAIVRSAIASIEPLAEKKGCEIILEAQSETIEAEIDSRRIERLLRNLLANAVEHGESNPVTVAVAGGAHAVAVSVTDNGVGMTRSQLDRVFDRFWRADPARKRTSGGTGLGLAISLEDANLHSGWLQVAAKPNEGSTFRLTLPRFQGSVFSQSPLPLPPRKKQVDDES